MEGEDEASTHGNEIIRFAVEAIKHAEQFIEAKGPEKKRYVMSELHKRYSLSPRDLQMISATIDVIVMVDKRVINLSHQSYISKLRECCYS